MRILRMRIIIYIYKNYFAEKETYLISISHN